MEENKMACQDCGMEFNSQEELDRHNANTGHGDGQNEMPESGGMGGTNGGVSGDSEEDM